MSACCQLQPPHTFSRERCQHAFLVFLVYDVASLCRGGRREGARCRCMCGIGNRCHESWQSTTPLSDRRSSMLLTVFSSCSGNAVDCSESSAAVNSGVLSDRRKVRMECRVSAPPRQLHPQVGWLQKEEGHAASLCVCMHYIRELVRCFSLSIFLH